MSVAPYLALVLGLASAYQLLAYKLKVPSILLLLVGGFALGQVVPPESVLGRDLLFAGVNIAVGIILFEGSLSLRFRELRGLSQAVLRLCTVTVLLAWLLITVAVGYGMVSPLGVRGQAEIVSKVNMQRLLEDLTQKQ